MEMNAKVMAQKFNESVALMKKNGMTQECLDLWMDLAEFGHLDSIEQIVYIVLERKEFEAAENYINLATNSKAPIILYLKARLIEERKGRDAAMEGFQAAAAAGNPNSISLMFDLALEACNFEEAQKYLDKLRGHEYFLSLLGEPTTFDDLSQKLDKRKKSFQDLSGFTAEEKVFTIAVGSDDTNTYLEVRVYDYYNKELVEKFNDDLIGAVEFCHSKDPSFEVIYVGDSWHITNTEIIYHCKVNWSQNKVTISENYEDYWFGELKDVDLAIEELIAKECDWELVNYHLAKSDESVGIGYEENDDDESDSDFVELLPEDFILAGSFRVKSGRTYIGDPSAIEDYLKKTPEENDVWTAFEGLNIFDFGDVASKEDKTGIVYVEKNDEGRIVKALISFDGEFEDDLSTENFVVGNWLLVNTGSLMVGDPSLLEDWETNNGEEWNLEGKIGKFSYQGASATTIANDYGVLANGKSVVFNTGYGDGNYYVFFLIKNQSGELVGLKALEEAGYTNWLTGFARGVPPDYEISKVVIDFLTEVE
jgi:hypothetical protein